MLISDGMNKIDGEEQKGTTYRPAELATNSRIIRRTSEMVLGHGHRFNRCEFCLCCTFCSEDESE